MSTAEAAAVSALREAIRAVSIGEDAAADARPDERDEPEVTLEVAHLLEAVARLMRTIDLDAVPASGSNHRLHAIVQHLDAGAELARRVGEQELTVDGAADAVGASRRGGTGVGPVHEEQSEGSSMPETRRDADTTLLPE